LPAIHRAWYIRKPQLTIIIMKCGISSNLTYNEPSLLQPVSAILIQAHAYLTLTFMNSLEALVEECALTAATIQLDDIARCVQSYSIPDLIVTRPTLTFVQLVIVTSVG
jgi:hypothetical protein